jgi:hypothetical protein
MLLSRIQMSQLSGRIQDSKNPRYWVLFEAPSLRLTSEHDHLPPWTIKSKDI